MTGLAEGGAVRVRLPRSLDIASVEPLASALLALRGSAIDLDASEVERLGALGLQLLLSARLTWRTDKVAFSVVDPSAAFAGDAALLGAPFLVSSEMNPDD